MSAHRSAIVLALVAAACQRGVLSSNLDLTSERRTTSPTLPTASASERVEPVAPGPAPPADACIPGQRIGPATLAALWPARLGTRVRFRSRVEASVDVMDVIVAAAGHRFLAVTGPDQLWQGEKERTFTVTGSNTVYLGGRTTLPQLLLEPECSP